MSPDYIGINPLANDFGGTVPQGLQMAVPCGLDGVECALIFGRQRAAIQKCRNVLVAQRRH